MGNIIAVVDVEKYVRRGQGEYVIQGWRASEDSRPIEIQVRGDEVTPIAFRAISFPRPDVLEARPELAVSEADIGFQITISNVEVLLQRFERVTVRLRQGERIPKFWCERTPPDGSGISGRGDSVSD